MKFINKTNGNRAYGSSLQSTPIGTFVEGEGLTNTSHVEIYQKSGQDSWTQLSDGSIFSSNFLFYKHGNLYFIEVLEVTYKRIAL